MQASSRNTSSSATRNCGPGPPASAVLPIRPARGSPTRPAQGPGGLRGLGQELGGSWDRRSQKAGPVPDGGLCLAHMRSACTRAPPVSIRATRPGLPPLDSTVSRRHLFSLMAPMQTLEAFMAITKAPASDDEQVGGRQRRGRRKTGWRVPLRGRQPDAHAQDATQPPSWARAQRGTGEARQAPWPSGLRPRPQHVPTWGCPRARPLPGPLPDHCSFH